MLQLTFPWNSQSFLSIETKGFNYVYWVKAGRSTVMAWRMQRQPSTLQQSNQTTSETSDRRRQSWYFSWPRDMYGIGRKTSEIWHLKLVLGSIRFHDKKVHFDFLCSWAAVRGAAENPPRSYHPCEMPWLHIPLDRRSVYRPGRQYRMGTRSLKNARYLCRKWSHYCSNWFSRRFIRLLSWYFILRFSVCRCFRYDECIFGSRTHCPAPYRKFEDRQYRLSPEY